MANSVEYLIKLMPDISNLTKLSSSDRAKVKNYLQQIMGVAQAEAGQIGTIVQDALTKNPNAKVGIDFDVDINELKKVMGVVSSVFHEIEKSGNPIEDWAKTGTGVYKTFVNLQNSVSTLSKDVKGLQDSLSSMNASFENFKSSYQSFRPAQFADIATQANKAGQSIGNIVQEMGQVATVSTKVDAALQKTYDRVIGLEQAINDASRTKFSFTSIKDAETELKKLEEQYKLIESNFDNGIMDDMYDAAPIVTQMKRVVSYVKKNRQDLSGSFSVNVNNEQEISDYFADFEVGIDGISKYIQKVKNNYQKALGSIGKDVSADALANQLKDIKLSLRVPSKSELVGQINTLLDSIKAEDLHGIDFRLSPKTLEDAANIIEDKHKNKSTTKNGEYPASDDANTDKLVDKTEQRFLRIQDKIEKSQASILSHTNDWRTKMIQAMSFAAKDFEFDFGNAGQNLYDALQAYFYDPNNKIDIQIDVENLASQIKTVIETNGLSMGTSGAAVIDASAIASVVASAIHSVFTGAPMPIYTPQDNGLTQEIPKVAESTERATEDTQQYIKQLNETSINIDNVITSLRKLAQVADKSKGATKISNYLTDKGINVGDISNGATDAQIIQMLQNTFMVAGEQGQTNRAFILDSLTNLKDVGLDKTKGSGKVIEQLRADIQELFDMSEIDTALVQELNKRKQALEVYQYAEKAGKSLALLNKVRAPLNPARGLKAIPSLENIDKLITDFSSKGRNVEGLTALREARVTLGDNTDEQAMAAFKTAALDFYQKSKSIFTALRTQLGDFVGEVYTEGRKKPYNITKANDFLRIPDDAIIVDVAVSKSLESTALDDSIIGSSSRRSSSTRRAANQERQLMRGGNQSADYLSSKTNPEIDVLNKKIEYEVFKQLEAPAQDINLDATLKTTRARIKTANSQIKSNESQLQVIDAQIQAQQATLTSSKQLVNAVSGSREPINQKAVLAAYGNWSLRNDIISNIIGSENNKQAFPEGKVFQETALVYPEIDKKLKVIDGLVAQRTELQKQLQNIEGLTVKEAQLRLKRIQDSETQAAILQSKKNRTSSEEQELTNLTNTLQKSNAYKNIYQNFLNGIDVKTPIINSLNQVNSQETTERSLLLEWAKSEAQKLPTATKEITKAAKPVIAQFKQQIGDLYSKAITTATQLKDKGIQGETRNTLVGQLQITLQLLKEADQEYSQLAKKIGGKTSLLSMEKQNRVNTLSKKYIVGQDSIATSRTTQAQDIEYELTRLKALRQKTESALSEARTEKITATNLQKKAAMQQKYLDLLQKQLTLQTEIVALEQNGASVDQINKKKTTLTQVNEELTSITSKLDAAGGILSADSDKEITDDNRMKHSLQEAKKYQEQLLIAYAQKRTIESRVSDVNRQQEQVNRYGLKAGLGASALYEAKQSLTQDFLNSDYVQTLEQALRDKVKDEISDSTNKSRSAFDERVTNAMTRMGWNPLDKTQTSKFLNTERGKQLSEDFANEVSFNEKFLWEQYNGYISDLRTKLLTTFKESFSLDKDGTLNAIFKTQNEDGSWGDTKQSVDVKTNLRTQLAERKKVLELQGQPLESTIADLKAQQKAAMAYGNITQEDVMNEDIIQQQIGFYQRINELNTQRFAQEQELNQLYTEGATDDEKQVQSKQKEITAIDEEIARYEVLINNRDKLIELRQKEKEDSKLSPEEQKLLATDKLIKAKEKLAEVEKQITDLAQKRDEARGTDNETKALKAYDDAVERKEKIEANITKYQNKVGKWSAKIEAQNVPNNTSSANLIGDGGILGALVSAVREGMSGVTLPSNIDTSELAKEMTLQAILSVLGGNDDYTSSTEAGGLGRNQYIKDIIFSLLGEQGKLEHLGMYNSQTGIASDKIFVGTKNRAEGDLGDTSGYDTMFHNHSEDTYAVPSAKDFSTFIEKFDVFKKQLIIANKEMTLFDFSEVTKTELEQIVDTYNAKSDAINEEFDSYRKNFQIGEKFGTLDNFDKQAQLRLKEALISSVSKFPNVLKFINPNDFLGNGLGRNTKKPSTQDVPDAFYRNGGNIDELAKKIEGELSAGKVSRKQTIDTTVDDLWKNRTVYEPKNLDFDTVKSKAIELKGVIDSLYDEGKTDTKEYIKAQLELSNILSAWRKNVSQNGNPEVYATEDEKANKNYKAASERWKTYLTTGENQIFDNLDNVTLSNIGKKDLTSLVKQITPKEKKNKTSTTESVKLMKVTLPDGTIFEGTKEECDAFLAASKGQSKTAPAVVDTEEKPVAKPKTKRNTPKLTTGSDKSYNDISSVSTANSGGGLIGIMRTELAKEGTLRQVLEGIRTIAQRSGVGKSNSANDLYEQFRRMLESDSWEDKERVAYMNLETGAMSNTITGDNASISAERLGTLYRAYTDKMDINAQVHTHANADDPYFSADDFKQFGIDFGNGIMKQILLSKNNISILDMTDVKDVNGLLTALSKTETNFEALATTSDKFGAKYASKAFDSLTPQGLIKLLGIKGVESKLNETETREAARKGVDEESAKEAADILQESTGRAVKRTVERVGIELETLTTKTDAKGNQTWTSQINNKYQKAMQTTNTSINRQIEKESTEFGGDIFGAGTQANLALVSYQDKYQILLDLVNKFKSASKDEQKGLQTQINELLITFDEAEKKLISLITRKDKFMGDYKPIKILDQADMVDVDTTLRDIATTRYGAENENVAFNGTHASQYGNGVQLWADVLKDGTITQYILEVDKATGQVKEYINTTNALANAFQNVNKAMKLNETVQANVGNEVNQESSLWKSYTESLNEMQRYVSNLWTTLANEGRSATVEEQDYVMALSERVIQLGQAAKKVAIDFKVLKEQNPESVTAAKPLEGGTLRDTLIDQAYTYAKANNSQYNFESFDNDTLKFKLTDIEGNIRTVTMEFNDMYEAIVTSSDKSVKAVDPLVAKIQKYTETMRVAKTNGFLYEDDYNVAQFQKITQQIAEIENGVNAGTLKFEEQKKVIEDLRQQAVVYGAEITKSVNKNKKAQFGNVAINSVTTQRSNILANYGDIPQEEYPKGLVEYEAVYQNLLTLQSNYSKQIADPTIQERLRQEALRVKQIGKEFISAAEKSKKLTEAVENSGQWSDSKGTHNLGGTKILSTDEVQNLNTTMRDYVTNTLGQAKAEHIKFDNINQKLTYTFRTSKTAVADMAVEYDAMTNSLNAYQVKERESLTGLPAFLKGLKAKMSSILQYLASMTSIYRVFSMLRQGVTYVKEIDSALTELKKVTDETTETYDKFLNTAAQTADKVGSTIKEVVSSTADWARLGYSLEDAAKLAENTSVLLNVSEFQSIDEATKALTSTLQAFSYTANESLGVVDVLNEV